MKKLTLILLITATLLQLTVAGEPRTTMNLNGTWEFDQTTTAFPPKKFTRKIPVPGLVHLAEPRIEEYDKFFKRPDKVEFKEQHNLYNLDYTPRYSWYRKKVVIPKDLEGKEGVITIKKSQYVTQVYVNGIDMGTSMACYTPVEFNISKAIKFGAENEILIKVGDRVWLPSEAAGGTDKEKEHYLPGIWDDVLLSFTGTMRVNRLLVLPSVAEKKVTVKALIRNFMPAQIFYGDVMSDSVKMDVIILEKSTGREVVRSSGVFLSKRDNQTEVMIDIPLASFTRWTPESPFLYTARVMLSSKNGVSDQYARNFGMRDFTRQGKFFYLNGSQCILRGTNVTLQRFFEDPDCGNLVWDKNWVKKFLIDYPKQLNWNAMRICVGIVPDFWYDLADEHGMMFQNEWLYWQNHGWDEQIRKEYTDWVWNDGSHPSIVIWDAINENWDDFIGNVLIPDLKKLDPTRVWDAGYMTSDKMANDEMDEPHPYQGPMPWNVREFEKKPYPLGNLDFRPELIQKLEVAGTAQLVNEYGWIWLWRNGVPSKLTVELYKYYLGENSTPQQNRELQAYWLQLETEWLRSNNHVAGVLAFCYLANNYGYTGDWFINHIKDLTPGPTMHWFQHCFAPAALFINLTDERYTKHMPPHPTGSSLLFNMAGVNNLNEVVKGNAKIYLLDSQGRKLSEKMTPVVLPSLTRKNIPAEIKLPDQAGGYVLVTEFLAEGKSKPVISRRYLKVGTAANYLFFEMNPGELK